MLGITWDSCTFPQQDVDSHEDGRPTRLTVFIGGTRQPKLKDWMAKGESELRAIALKAVKEQLGVDEAPKSSEVVQMENAIAQYTVGHKSRYFVATHIAPRCSICAPCVAYSRG
eukprot:SAG31_NODE_12535_length_934_cov_0.988024_2_plen_114_part_00